METYHFFGYNVTMESEVTKQSQARYVLHQGKNKAAELEAIMRLRHSNRIFDKKPVESSIIEKLADSAKWTPSSCDRRAVRLKLITERDDKDLLGGLLVGGTGFIHRAPAIFLLFADIDSYKAGDPPGSEVNFSAPLDAGVIIQQLYLMATSLGLHCAIVNPQIRQRNQDYFYQQFKPKSWTNPLFLGAFCFGYPSELKTDKKYDYNYDMLVD